MVPGLECLVLRGQRLGPGGGGGAQVLPHLQPLLQQGAGGGVGQVCPHLASWWVLDTFQPAIEVEESYMASPDHGAVYEMAVSVLDADLKILGQPFTFRDDVRARPV